MTKFYVDVPVNALHRFTVEAESEENALEQVHDSLSEPDGERDYIVELRILDELDYDVPWTVKEMGKEVGLLKILDHAIGDLVHINKDDEQWGRIADDGFIETIYEDEYLIRIPRLMASIIVNEKEIN